MIVSRGCSRAVTVSDREAQGITEVDVWAAIRALKVPSAYLRGQRYVEAPPKLRSSAGSTSWKKQTRDSSDKTRRGSKKEEAKLPDRPRERVDAHTQTPSVPQSQGLRLSEHGDGEKIMTHLEYERAKFALEHALKQRSRRYVGLAILFCLAWAVVAAAFITSVAVGHWSDLDRACDPGSLSMGGLFL